MVGFRFSSLQDFIVWLGCLCSAEVILRTVEHKDLSILVDWYINFHLSCTTVWTSEPCPSFIPSLFQGKGTDHHWGFVGKCTLKVRDTTVLLRGIITTIFNFDVIYKTPQLLWLIGTEDWKWTLQSNSWTRRMRMIFWNSITIFGWIRNQIVGIFCHFHVSVWPY